MDPYSFLTFMCTWKHGSTEGNLLLKECDNTTLTYAPFKTVMDENGIEIHLIHLTATTHVYFVSDREFILSESLFMDEVDNSAVRLGSVITLEDFSECDLESVWPKPSSKLLRGVMHLFCYTVKKTGKKSVEIEFLLHAESGGLIPDWVGNRTSISQVACVKKYVDVFLHRQLKKNKEENKGQMKQN